MKLSKIEGVPASLVRYLAGRGIDELYPPQLEAIKAGLLDGKSVMVSAPTASGKTLVAMLALVAMLGRGGRKAVYLSPLRALASEKYLEFSDLQDLNLPARLSVSVSAGDLNSRDNLRGNLLCMTNERMDLALRKDEAWVDDLDLVIVDEIHLIGDAHRGPTLEMVLTRLRQKGRQFVALSATITNDAQLADWLGCSLVSSDWRPVPLREGVFYKNQIMMQNGSRIRVPAISRDAPASLAAQTVRDGGQALIFVNTRRSAPARAQRAADAISETLDGSTLKRLRTVSDTIKQGSSGPLADSLAGLVSRGVAFHHAGLDQTSRQIIERNFRAGLIKVLAATTTLAAGVNLPARRVIISDITRYDANLGFNAPIPVMEYKQLCGRAGRPQYDDSGEAIIAASSYPDHVMAEYVHGVSEPVESRLDSNHSLGVHALSVVDWQPGITIRQLEKFFDATLGGYLQYAEYDIDGALQDLLDLGMIKTLDGNRYATTKLGSLATILYLEPRTARSLADTISAASYGDHTLGFLHAISVCSEFFPVLQLRQKDHDAAENILHSCRSQLIHPVHTISRSLMGLHAWINEETERAISEEYGVDPGDVRRITENARWLAYCMSRLAKHVGRPETAALLDVLRMRISHGVKPDIIPLVRIRDVGRVRGRALRRAGARTPADVAAMAAPKISAVCRVGPKAGARIKQEAGRL